MLFISVNTVASLGCLQLCKDNFLHVLDYCDKSTAKNLFFVDKNINKIILSSKYFPTKIKRFEKTKGSLCLKETKYQFEVMKTFSFDFQIKYFLSDYYRYYGVNCHRNKQYDQFSFVDFLNDNVFPMIKQNHLFYSDKDTFSCYLNDDKYAVFLCQSNDQPYVNNCFKNMIKKKKKEDVCYVVGSEHWINQFLDQCPMINTVKILHLSYTDKSNVLLHEKIQDFQCLDELYLGFVYDGLGVKKELHVHKTSLGEDIGVHITVNLDFLPEKLSVFSAPRGYFLPSENNKCVDIQSLWIESISNMKLVKFPYLRELIFSISEVKHYKPKKFSFENASKQLQFVKILLCWFDPDYSCHIRNLIKSFRANKVFTELHFYNDDKNIINRGRGLSIFDGSDRVTFDSFDNSLLKEAIANKEKIEIAKLRVALNSIKEIKKFRKVLCLCQVECLKKITLLCKNDFLIPNDLIDSIFLQFFHVNKIKIGNLLSNQIMVYNRSMYKGRYTYNKNLEIKPLRNFCLAVLYFFVFFDSLKLLRVDGLSSLKPLVMAFLFFDFTRFCKGGRRFTFFPLPYHIFLV